MEPRLFFGRVSLHHLSQPLHWRHKRKPVKEKNNEGETSDKIS